MKVLVIPDVHHKIEKAQTIIDEHEGNVDVILHLGDHQDNWDDSQKDTEKTLNWTIGRLKAGDKIIMGNHDYCYWMKAMRRDSSQARQNTCSGWRLAKQVVFNDLVDGGYRKYCNDFPITVDIDGILYSHGGVRGSWKFREKDIYTETAMAKLWNDFSPIWIRPVDYGMCYQGKQIVGHTIVERPTWDRNILMLDTMLKHYAIVTDGVVEIREVGIL